MTASRFRAALLAPVAAASLAGCGLNSVPTAEENVNKAFADVQAGYQRRANLIPNLVETVKGYAAQERSILIGVTEARAGANRVQLSTADLADPAKVKAYTDAQARVSATILPLQRLQEAYPDLKSNQNFMALQDQLEGTENRIETSVQDYNEAVRVYNTTIRTFPDAIGAKVFYGAKPKVPFQATAEAQSAPPVTFNTGG